MSARVILHLDCDCFYAQVEHERLGIPRDVPLAVQQWDGLIAVNYAARAAGVKRGMPTQTARELCSSIVLVHVNTTTGEPGMEGTLDRQTAKADLGRYREASRRMFEVLEAAYDSGIVVEKAGLDEVQTRTGARPCGSRPSLPHSPCRARWCTWRRRTLTARTCAPPSWRRAEA